MRMLSDVGLSLVRLALAFVLWLQHVVVHAAPPATKPCSEHSPISPQLSEQLLLRDIVKEKNLCRYACSKVARQTAAFLHLDDAAATTLARSGVTKSEIGYPQRPLNIQRSLRLQRRGQFPPPFDGQFSNGGITDGAMASAVKPEIPEAVRRARNIYYRDYIRKPKKASSPSTAADTNGAGAPRADNHPAQNPTDAGRGGRRPGLTPPLPQRDAATVALLKSAYYLARKFEQGGRQTVPDGAAELATQLEPLLAQEDAAKAQRTRTAPAYVPRAVSPRVQQLREEYVAFVREFQRHSADGVGATPPADEPGLRNRHVKLLDGYIAYRDYLRTGDATLSAADMRALKRERERYSAGYKRLTEWLRQTKGSRDGVALKNRVRATGDAGLMGALDDYNEYHRIDMKMRNILKQKQQRDGQAASQKRLRTAAELRASIENSKRGSSVYRSKYEKGMTEEERRQLLLEGDMDEVIAMLAAYEDFVTYERDSKALRKVQKGAQESSDAAEEEPVGTEVGQESLFSALQGGRLSDATQRLIRPLNWHNPVQQLRRPIQTLARKTSDGAKVFRAELQRAGSLALSTALHQQVSTPTRPLLGQRRMQGAAFRPQLWPRRG